jgi:spermidine/putrescine transport system ATP-binding protein
MLELVEISRQFGKVHAVDRLSLTVGDGEFVTLLGPSGCGKTTLLRIVGGFEDPNAGHVFLDGRDVTYLPAHRRPVNTVFQRSVLFPHLSIADNVAFGLRVAGIKRSEVRSRVEAALELVDLKGFGPRRADEVSGGQAQRVSLARALVNQPRLLLLDEPLSALDLKVRVDMQGELRRIHRETGATFLYVTHDQQEAMALSDRIAVMRDGRIEQVGPPSEVYYYPNTSFVATFVGNSNVLPVEVLDEAECTVFLRSANASLPVARLPEGAMKGWLVIRPELLRLEREGGHIRGVVADRAFLGAAVRYEVRAGDETLRIHEAGADVQPRFTIGDEVAIDYDRARAIFLEGTGTHPELPRDASTMTHSLR